MCFKQTSFTSGGPPSVAVGLKLTINEAKQTKETTTLRIHVERNSTRIREFSILKPHSIV